MVSRADNSSLPQCKDPKHHKTTEVWADNGQGKMIVCDWCLRNENTKKRP